ncbi:hypothetical protein BPAE_0022g00150 [Botrytis paeoniae]|uniref:chitinase n=1 Tax=Botrytis paeoniae TaxID=278948 RepID=A0A4Z1FWE0_9HELO|nr:hypothetical protein BPAE_0022g00150 [Botrytis paeoniae]
MKYLSLLQAGVVCAFFSCFVNAQDNCSPSKPCAQGYYSSEGSCGFGSAYCGEGCQGTCDAQSECGQNAPAGDLLCPLNVCCSYYGYCGTTDLFCTNEGDTPCQNGCDAVRRPSCSVDSKAAQGISIGYYESWSYNRPCDSFSPEKIQGSAWTHLNYAFALIDTTTFQISQMNDFDTQLYTKFTGLKANFPGLKTYISVGGWAAGGQVLSDMVSISANRQAFIDSALRFVKTYAFDGIDIDWEYPAAEDQGGVAADTANFVQFMKELRSAFGTLGITTTLPSSYWYLQGFEVKNLQGSVDWFNLLLIFYGEMPNFDEEDGVIVIREINSTRLPTPEEMEKYLGYTKCSSEDYHEEIAEIRSQFENFKSEAIAQTSIPRAEPSSVFATASFNTHATQLTALLASARSQPGSGYHSQPLETTAASRKGDS